MNPLTTLRRVVHAVDTSAEALAAIREGAATQSSLLNREMRELMGICNRMAALQQAQVEVTLELVKALGRLTHADLDTARIERELEVAAGSPLPPGPEPTAPSANAGRASLKEAMANVPLMLAEKTFNTSHPDYDATRARNFPDTILNATKPCVNPVYRELLTLASRDEVPARAWDGVLAGALEEVKTDPHAHQVFQRKEQVERYVRDLSERYQAHYVPGWVNVEDALFLYWLVRKLRPRTIVQTGVCNGLSSSFMVLALARNGPEGRLHAVDLAPVFDPADPAWTVKDRVYGVVIPEGRSSGWLVPDAYRDRLEVQPGDAKQVLAPLIAQLDGVDLFFHDSDHTYDHMLFEFREVKKKLSPGGLIVADDISWNASLWDFADDYGVPSYNYRGAVGTAFF